MIFPICLLIMLAQEQTHNELVNELLTGNQSVHMCVLGLSLKKIRKLSSSWGPDNQQKFVRAKAQQNFRKNKDQKYILIFSSCHSISGI